MHRLSPPDADYLLRVLPLEQALRARLEAFRAGKGALTEDDCCNLRELVGDRLCEVGFGENYALTPEGARLEELIDLLFIA